MVRLLSKAGVPTVVVARRADRLETLANELDGVEVLVADLVDPDGLARVTERLSDGQRPIELLVNNAGFGSSGPFIDTEPDRLDDMVELNVDALTHLTRAAAVVMAARSRGWILNVSSIAGFQPSPGFSVYSATKAYVVNLSEGLHVELRPHGVHVTALCPGLTRTEFQEVAGAKEMAARAPGAAWLRADHVAEAGLKDCARGRALSVPGVQYKAAAALSDITPRWMLRQFGAVTQRFR